MTKEEFERVQAAMQSSTKGREIQARVDASHKAEKECERHNFKPIDGTLLYECENCGCKMSAAFVAGYERGLEHGLKDGS